MSTPESRLLDEREAYLMESDSIRSFSNLQSAEAAYQALQGIPCSTVALLSLFGPDRIDLSLREYYQLAENFLSTLALEAYHHGFLIAHPKTSSEFVNKMYNSQTVAALVFPEHHATHNSLEDHVFAIVPILQVDQADDTRVLLERQFVVADTNSYHLMAVVTKPNELVELYTQANVLPQGARSVLVFERPEYDEISDFDERSLRNLGIFY